MKTKLVVIFCVVLLISCFLLCGCADRPDSSVAQQLLSERSYDNIKQIQGNSMDAALKQFGLLSKQVEYMFTATKGRYPDMHAAYAICTKKTRTAKKLEASLSGVGFAVYRTGCLVIADSQ